MLIEQAETEPAKPGRWIAEGLRAALLLRPDFRGLRPTPGLLAGLCLFVLIFGVAVQRLSVPGPAVFYWQSLASGWGGPLISLWLCWIVAHGRGGGTGTRPPLQTAATLFGVLIAQSWVIGMSAWLAYLMLGAMGDSTIVHEAMWWITPVMLVWSLAATVRLLWPQTASASGPRLAMLGALLVSAALGAAAPRESYWYPDPAARADRGESPRFKLTQEDFEAQSRAFAEQLASLAPQRSGIVDLYALTVAPYASEDVFLRESTMVADVMRSQFDAEGRVLQLVNHSGTAARFAWATPVNVQRAIAGLAQVMDRNEDVLFIHLTSHGAKDGKLAAGFWPLHVDGISAADLKQWLDDAGIRFRVISVSACYSGTWLAPLRDENTLVMTASDAEHTSYGCGRRSQLTYFGRAVFDEQLRHSVSFEAAHATARPIIEQRERQAGKSDGFSNPQIHVGRAVRERLAMLEARLAATPQR